MVLTKEEAVRLLEEAKKTTPDTGWIDHSLCVGETAGVIAQHLGLDKEKAITLGYIHDIGKRIGDYDNHVMNGYEYLKSLGYDEEYCHICLTHSFLNNDVNCQAGGYPEANPFRDEFIRNHEYTPYEKIINLCDLMCKGTRLTLEERLIELIARKGSYDNTVYHIREAQKLKEQIEKLLGCSVYQLFPDIGEKFISNDCFVAKRVL